MKRVVFSAGVLLLAAVAAAQTPSEVLYNDDFQSYGTPADPPGWVDNPIGVPRREADGLFKTWPDPLQSGNVVYGTRQASGQPDGTTPRIGTFTTLTTHSFSGQGRFEYRGRMLRTNAETRIGLTFFSSYTEVDRYYLVGLWSRPTTGVSMQLFGFGAGSLTGTLDSNFTPDPNVWYRFLVQVDDVNDSTKIRARFWRDGTTEPSTFAIDATDAAAGRLRGGRIGLWSAVRGDAYIDDVFAKSPVDHTAPAISFFESNVPLADGSKFNRNATPEIRVTDDLSTFSYTATLDGAPFTSLTEVTAEAWHTLAVHAVDGPGNVADAQIRFLVDKTAPVVLILEGTTPFLAGSFFNRDVVGRATVTDLSQTTVTATVDGQLYTLGTPIAPEGGHTIAVTAVDEVGWSTTTGPLSFTIDKTKPQLTFTSHREGDVLTAAHAVFKGGSDDAITVVVAGSPATIDAAAKVFTTADLSLLEGESSIVASGTDRAGNVGTTTVKLFVDTRAPALTITAPAADACVDAQPVEIRGSALDLRLDTVKVTIGSTTVTATVDTTGNWTAAVPVADEGRKLVTVEATDKAGHTVSASRSVFIDRSAPSIEVRENSDTFAGGVLNRAAAIFVSTTDSNPNVTLVTTLDGSPYTSGTPVTAEGSHTLAVTATDCAGHVSQKSIQFTVDMTAPSIRDLTPANGGTVGAMPSALAGKTDADVATVEIAGTPSRAVPDANGAFSIAVAFEEGVNRFTLTARDRAGNSTSVEYAVTIKTTAPVVEIRESGSPIAAGALFNRAVTPLIRSVEPQATIAATLNGASYTSGTTIATDGDYTLRATATDSFGHAGTAEATFTIDRTPPAVKITTPAAVTLHADQVEVRGTAGDAQTANLNGQPLTLTDGAFVTTVTLEVGANALVLAGRDRAGNVGRDEVIVTRDDVATGVLITYPPDRSRTNRPATDVIGRVLTPGRATLVTVGSTTVPVDPTGLFRLSGYDLVEGENTITATATATNGFQTSASARVTADFTPPALTIAESGQPLTDGARYAERAVISLLASDAGGGAVVTELTVDGTKIASMPFTITAAGGHSLVAVARDLAGNETRAERTLFIGASTSAACTLDSFDPTDGAIVLSNQTEMTGRSGGAAGVKVNGVAAIVADGAFCARVELPVEGANSIRIVCTDAAGNETGTAKTITFHRVTGQPSITIDTPAEAFVSAQETIAVTGVAGPGVVNADVNGVAATFSGTDSSVARPYSVAGVRLAGGLNMVVAHGRNAAGRVATASRRGVYLKDAPAISISSPSAGMTTGLPRVTVSGTYTGLDPATIVVSSLGQTTPAQAVRFSDTTGSFTAVDIPLVTGEQTLRVSGRDRLNREGSATVAVRLVAGAPGIAITQPANHTSFGGGSDSLTVSGMYQAASGSQVDVNGISSTLSGSSYTASVKFSTLAGGITPIVARVTQPDGASASTTVIVTQLAEAPRVVESFPAANAVEVDNGALLLVLFSQPMDVATIATAFRLEDTAGTPVSGSLYLDKDVLTFAPAAQLTAGARYTLRVSTAARNLAGTALAADFTTSFTTSTSAPATAPTVTPLGSAICGQSVTVNGTATPSARVRLEAGTLVLNTNADAAGRFTFNFPLSGQSGFTVIRVRVVGSDGSVSPAAELKVRVDCSGPQVMNASYDRVVNKLTIQFSESINASTATVGAGNAIALTLDDGRAVAGSASVAQNIVTVTPAEDLSAKSFSLAISTAIKDTIGNPLLTPFSQSFSVAGDQPSSSDGAGFISGEVYDATTGRPLSGVAITIDVASTAPVSTTADARGRYLARLPEGAHTITAARAGYTTVSREIIVPAGAGVIPIDIRLTRRGEARTSDGSAIALTHGGDNVITRKVELNLPGGALPSGRKVALTAVGAQALVGLLPLGWSPAAAAEVTVDDSDAATTLAGAQLTFTVPAAEITAAAQNLTAVAYNALRDEWMVMAAVVNVGSDGKVALPIARSGAYALVYPDKAAGLTPPPLPVSGDVLRGVPEAPADAPALVKRDFTLDPPIVLPSGRTVATLRIEGSGGVSFPSGTAVQAYIDEELRLADGSRLLDPPFATDLLLYRTLAGDLGVADFHLAPSPKASEVILEMGVDHIRVFPYPGRLDRGTLIGSEGGRVPADDKVSVEIASGAVAEPLRATAMSLSASDLNALGAIAGFRVLGGFHLTLQRATQPPPIDLDGDGAPDPIDAPELFIPARATFTVDAAKLPTPGAQVILAELLDQTPHGRMMRLAVPMMSVDAGQTATTAIRFTTKTIDRSVLPVDGVMHEGRYVVLAAEAPIAFVTGTVRQGSATGRLVADARVLAPPLGVAELSRSTGIYNIPVAAKPAGPFTLAPRHITTGDGAVHTHTSAVDSDTVTRIDLALIAQPPVLGAVVVLKGEPPSQATLSPGTITTDVALTTNIRASFTPSIDPASVTADSIIVTDAITGAKVNGRAAADGSVAVVWTLTAGQRLRPNATYVVAIVPTIRGTNGATLSQGATYTLETVREILNNEIRRERIRITIPDANGLSKITGLAGALPAGWQAVAVRRGRGFIEQYQATAASDGAFSFNLGGGHPSDKITIADLIDLQVVSNIGNLAAIFSLTPFTSEDGKSFVAPAGAAIRFTTPENITLDVPAGAFDEPTVVSVTAATKAEFMDIEFLDRENEYVGSARVDFEGVAKKPLGLEVPLPPGFETAGKTFILAEKGMSPVGPRLAMLDLMRVSNGKLITDHENTTGQQAVVLNPRGLQPGADATLTGSKFTKYLQMLMRSGIFMALDIKVYGVGGSVGFGVMQGLQQQYDFIWDIYASYYIPHIHIAERGGALLPIISGRRFTVTGFDPGTGLQAVSRTYDPVPFGEPGTVAPIPSTEQNDGGPYPVFGGPFRVEMLDLDVEEVDITAIRNFSVRLDNNSVRVSPGATPLESDVKVTLLNVSKGLEVTGTAASSLQLSAELGNRIVLLIEEHRIDSTSPISVVFSEPIFLVDPTDPDIVDINLHDLIKVEYAAGPSGNFSDITAQVRFSTDSGQRRVTLKLPSALQSEARYRITLKPDIADVVDDGPGLKLGQGTVENDGALTPVGGGNALELFFDVRKPAGELGTFSGASAGLIRGMDLSGNVLFVAATEGGLIAYDVSNAAALGGGAPQLAKVPGIEVGIRHQAVTVDRHNRVYTTAMQPASGVFRSYRVEDFVDGGNVEIVGNKLINWKIGFSQGLGLPSNTVLSDIPESIPFRIKVLLQDDEQDFSNRKAFVDGTGASETGDYPVDDIKSYTLTVGKDSPYRVQRITVENLSLDMRWSADAKEGSAVIQNIIARSTDKMRLIRNQRTYAVVAHLGYGIGIYDANAIESNGLSPRPAPGSPSRLREQMVLTAGQIDRMFCVGNQTPDYGIIENYITTDAELRSDASGQIYSYSVDTYRGVLDLQLNLPSADGPGTGDDDCEQRPTPNTGGLLFQTAPVGHEVPRLQALRSAVMGAAGRQPFPHFGQLARFTWSISGAQNRTGARGVRAGQAAFRDYLLVAGGDYGVIVVDIDSSPRAVPLWPLKDENVADVIWIPGGATGVRVYQSANVAVVSDRYGRVLVVDLSRIDERWDEDNQWVDGLFPTVKKALAGTPTDGYGIGADDPRILWKSQPGVHMGAAAPVFDPYTGMIFASNIQNVKVLSGLDPRVKMKVNLGDPNGLSEVGGIVPLGIAPPRDIQSRIDALPACDGSTIACKESASLGVFQLEVSLPGDMTDSLTMSGNELQFAVESERVAGAVTEQTPSGFARAHLRRTRRDGNAENSDRAATGFKFKRIVPEPLRGALKSQRGYNRFVSPWIVALADPRASEEYEWQEASTKQQKKEAGCDECERPKHLKNKTEGDGVYELATNGRFITVRPELNGPDVPIFQGTIYSYLGLEKRLLGRFSTIMADTVRPTEVVVAGQNPPIANGALQETTFLHSGEVEADTVDFDTGGRAGVNVLLDRTYRSRTIGGSVFGQGWDSSLLRRLRALPNGDVEYRDGSEVWRFRFNRDEGYDSPKGLFLKLARTTRGWKLIDQAWRIVEFDDMGRLLAEYDEFYDPQIPDSGNVIRYVYDETGRLSLVIDPVKRATTIKYWGESEGGQGAYPGLVREIVDWRDRKLNYQYDGDAGTLTRALLPEVANTTNSRPTIEYAYTPVGGSYSNRLELRTNLESIKEPQQVVAGGPPRVKFTYSTGGGFMRDRVLRQDWGAGESAQFTYNSRTSVMVRDALGQNRDYALNAEPPKDYFSDRPHVQSEVEQSVTISSTPFGQLPESIAATEPATTAANRTKSYTYDGEGQILTETLNGVRSVTYSYIDVRPAAPGFIPAGAAVTPMAGPGSPINQNVTYQSGANRSTFMSSVSANGLTIEAPEPSRNYREVSASNDSINSTGTFDRSGLQTAATGTGGTDSSSGGSNATMQWAGTDAAKHERAQLTGLDVGGLKTTIRYPSPQQRIETDPRGVVTTTDFDAWDRPTRVTMVGPRITVEERLEYDATGRLAKQVSKQGSVSVTKTSSYDVMGRLTAFSMDNVANTGTATTTISHDVPGRTTVVNHPSGSVTTMKLDSLGRMSRRETTTGGGTAIVDYFAYDLLDNIVFTTDLFDATASAYDAHGRPAGEMNLAGIKTEVGLDGWGRPTSVRKSTGGQAISEATMEFTPAGRLKSVTKMVDGQPRVTTFAWDGGGRGTGMSSAGRAIHARYDSADRLLAAEAGSGSATSVSDAIRSADVSGHTGTLPQALSVKEKGSAYALALEYNTIGRAVTHNLGNLGWARSVDQAGNVTMAKAPSRSAHTYEYDARGALRVETLPGGAVNSYAYHATGALAGYTDPANEVTETVNDLIGRPIVRKYKDGTEEKIEWEGRRVKSITDRQRRVQSFTYNAKGQISEVTAAEGGVVLDRIEYDGAARVIKWTTPDAILEFSDFDSEGRPKKTSQARVLNGTTIDKYTQEHTWDIRGERTSWTMPTYPLFFSSRPWTKLVQQQHDAFGNITKIERTVIGATSGGVFLDASYRSLGRPDQRTLTTPAAAGVGREYRYDAANGLLNRMAVSVGGKIIAGSEVEFDGLQRTRARLLGLSGGGRADEWFYDGRSRLLGSSLARDGDSTPQTEGLTGGDFRTSLDRPAADTPVDPPSIKYTEDSRGGHKISIMERGGIVEQFVFNGGERVSDGRFAYTYDTKGRLITVAQRSGSLALRRAKYFYDGRNRLVGRRTEYAVVTLGTEPRPEDWRLEDRPEVLASDALPAETTFVWDPITDQLVAIFKAGASENTPQDGSGGLLRQIIHGGAGYDDPLEVTAVDGTVPAGVSRLYPVYDEAGARSLQVVLNDRGEIVSRSVAAGPYGEDQAILAGPAVDKIDVSASKDADGNLESVNITLRSTEQIAAATVASGFRLAAVGSGGAVVRAASGAALNGEAAVRWSLTGDEWTTLMSGGGAAISVGVTGDARGAAWSTSTRYLAAPSWAVETKPVFASSAMPIEVRESLAGLSQWLASIPAGGSKTTTLYEVPTLYALGAPRTAAFTGGDPQRLIVSSPFHAHPFQDPLTGQNYVRARWFDLHSGAWLTPDPGGYVDGSNLYAYAGGDPVNASDPTGRQTEGSDDDPPQGGRVGRFFKWLVKEAAATTLEELTPVGIANGLVTAVVGYDAVRDEEVQGFLPRVLSAVSAIPLVPSSIRKVGDAIPESKLDDAARLVDNAKGAKPKRARRDVSPNLVDEAGDLPPPRQNIWNEYEHVTPGQFASRKQARDKYREFQQVLAANNVNRNAIRVTRGSGRKVAVVGQNMNRVRAVANHLGGAEVFERGVAGVDELGDAFDRFDRVARRWKAKGYERVPDHIAKRTKLFRKDGEWIEKLKREGYTIIDIGVDPKAAHASVWYMMEELVLYGAK
jgi:RHS repeat-associated protein